MFISYLRDMKSWISLFRAVTWICGCTYLAGCWHRCRVYICSCILIFCCSVIFSLFIIWRYRKEMKFTKELSDLAEEQSKDWQEALPETIFIRDEITSEIFRQAVMAFFSKELADIRASKLSSKVTILLHGYMK